MRQVMALLNFLDGIILLLWGVLGFLMSGMYSLLVVSIFAAFEIFAGVKLWDNKESGYVMTITARALQCVTIPHVPISVVYAILFNTGVFIKLSPLFPHIISSKDVAINIGAVVLLLLTILLYIRYRRKIKSEGVR